MTGPLLCIRAAGPNGVGAFPPHRTSRALQGALQNRLLAVTTINSTTTTEHQAPRVDDSTFVVATNSNGAVIAHNKVTVKTPFANQGTGILDFGSNVNLSITDNQIKGGAASGTSGINIRALSGVPSTNTRATNNHVNNRYNGVRLTDNVTGDTVSGNHIAGSQNDGIFMESGSSNKFLKNEVKTSSVHDCQDLTSGTGTAGTANQWTGNSGASNNSSPAAICPRH